MKKYLFGVVGLLICLYLISLTYIALHVYDNTAKQSDAIVILGARSTFKDTINPCLVARVKKGVELEKQGFSNTIIMSGGIDNYGEDSEAAIMKRKALQFGAPANEILLEDKSKNTYENLLFTKKILSDHHLSSIIIVSDPYHLPRAALIAKTLQISYTVASAEDSPCWNKYKFLGIDYFRDGLALIEYFMTGKIKPW